METPLAHRDVPGGLFIGASMRLFALMNSAPAELLHPLDMQRFSQFGYVCVTETHDSQPKKTPAIMPAREYCSIKTKPFFEEKAALAEEIG